MMGEEIEVGGIGYDKTLLWNYNVITSMFPLIFDVLSNQSAVKIPRKLRKSTFSLISIPLCPIFLDFPR